MIANALQNIFKIEARIWEAADQLRANSKLSSSEYCMPVTDLLEWQRKQRSEWDREWDC